MQKRTLGFKLIKEFKSNYRKVVPTLVNELGDSFVLTNPFQNMHVFTNPSLLEHVLFKKFTNYIRPPNPMFDPVINSSTLTPLQVLERWRHFRSTLLNPTMTESAVKQYATVMAKKTIEHMETVWDKHVVSQEPFAIYPDLERITLKNLITTELYDAPLDIEEVTILIDEVAHLAISYEMSLSKLAWKFPTKTRRHTNEVVQHLIEVSDKVIAHCISENTPDTIFKQAICAAGEDPKNPNLKNNKELWGFLRAIAGGYITGGFDTLSRNLAVTGAYLALFPDVVCKIRNELKKEIPDGVITADNVEKLEYSRAVFHEGLRYSGGVVPIISRLSLDNDDIDGYKVKKGDRVMLPLFYLLGLKSYWQNPEEYNPDRFLDINMMDARFRYIYVPFSAGIRGCSGRNFAALEATVLIALMAQRYNFKLASNPTINSDNPAAIRLILSKNE